MDTLKPALTDPRLFTASLIFLSSPVLQLHPNHLKLHQTTLFPQGSHLSYSLNTFAFFLHQTIRWLPPVSTNLAICFPRQSAFAVCSALPLSTISRPCVLRPSSLFLLTVTLTAFPLFPRGLSDTLPLTFVNSPSLHLFLRYRSVQLS